MVASSSTDCRHGCTGSETGSTTTRSTSFTSWAMAVTTRLFDGVLYFTDEYGRSERVRASRLGTALGAHDPLRLVVLNACQSGWAQSGSAFDGLAQGLIQQGCVAVVAMQFPISDEAAAVFAETFYREARERLPRRPRGRRSRQALMDKEQTATEWATPVVFLRSDDPHIFSDADGGMPSVPGQAPPSQWVGSPVMSARPLTTSGRLSYENFDLLRGGPGRRIPSASPEAPWARVRARILRCPSTTCSWRTFSQV